MTKALLIAIIILPYALLAQIDERIIKQENETAVMVIGDWGRNGEYFQKELADAMGKAAIRIEPEFIISTGDNFYPDGIASVEDPLWLSSFENVYHAHSLFCPWYVVLGNHDIRGNAQAQIDYTYRSRRWNMPSKYYSFSKTLEDESKAEFIFLDTNPFNSDYFEEEKYRDYVATQDTAKQKLWLEKKLEQDNLGWKIVIGHHPMYTGGKRKEEVNYVRKSLENMLCQNKVDVYLAGHEHDLQLIQSECKVYHIVSGAGSEVRPVEKLPSSLFAESVQGIAILYLSELSCRVQFMDYKGQLLFEYTILKQG